MTVALLTGCFVCGAHFMPGADAAGARRVVAYCDPPPMAVSASGAHPQRVVSREPIRDATVSAERAQAGGSEGHREPAAGWVSLCPRVTWERCHEWDPRPCKHQHVSRAEMVAALKASKTVSDKVSRFSNPASLQYCEEKARL